MEKKIQIASLVLGSIQTNCYLIHKEGEKQLIVVDPAQDAAEICHAAEKMGASVGAVLLTHGHYDHIGVATELQRNGAVIYAMEAERDLLADPRLNLSMVHGCDCSVHADNWLHDEESHDICGVSLRVLATPGHTAGGGCYLLTKAGVLVAGDTLFAGSVGRSDLPTGDMKTLMASIKSKLVPLPDEVAVLPGHGPATTIGREKMYNRYMMNL